MFEIEKTLTNKELYYIRNSNIRLNLDKNIAEYLNISLNEYKDILSKYNIEIIDNEIFFTSINEINEFVDKLNILLKLKK